MENNQQMVLWQGHAGVEIPQDADTAESIVVFAGSLTEKQQKHVINVFKDGAFDMGAEYVWKRSMTRLRSTLSTLGMKFIGEMLGRDDIDEYSVPEVVLTEYNCIGLAEQLGVVSTTGAIKLKQAIELINHYFDDQAIKEGEELNKVDGINIILTCVKYILGEQDISVALEFSNFRSRLLSETIKVDDMQIDQLINSPIFYIRTTIAILLTAIKNEKGAKVEHALANFVMLIDPIWNKIGEKDKYTIGSAYRDVTASGNISAAGGLKKGLMKVGGFDYVPENLRSSTYRKAAKALVDAHFAANNFYNEPKLVKHLSSLGSNIPPPALIDCIQAYMCVYLGNYWGVSYEAVGISEEELRYISPSRWNYYFEKVFHNDDIILGKLTEARPMNRFKDFIKSLDIGDLDNLPKDNKEFLEAVLNNKLGKADAYANTLYNRLKKKSN